MKLLEEYCEEEVRPNVKVETEVHVSKFANHNARPRFSGKCFHRGKIGHRKTDCRQLERDERFRVNDNNNNRNGK